MKFYPRNFHNITEVHSIVWSGRHGAYVLSADGKDCGDVVVDRNEFLQIMNGNYECLKEIGYDDVKKYSAIAYTNDSNMTGKNEFKVNISKRLDDNQLPFGVFKLKETHDGLLFVPYATTVKNGNIIKNKDLRKMVTDFFNGEKAEGRKNKKGILLYGPPGNGKTTEIMQLFDLCEAMQLRIYIVASDLHLSNIDGAQKLLEKDKNIFILEEITERTNNREIEHLLTFLDGESSWNNSVVLATTNYPKDLPANLVDRPGRFDTFIEYGNPTKEDITNLGAKFDLSPEDVAVLGGKGLSFDYCSFIMSQSKKTNATVKDTLAVETEKKQMISSTFKGKIGIN